MTDGASVVGTTPQSRHPGHQMRKFLTKDSAAGTFETVDHFCHTSSRVRCDKQMYVVWHHFHSLDETPYCCAVTYRTCLSRCSTSPTRTLRRYFGQNTMWYDRLKTAPAFLT